MIIYSKIYDVFKFDIVGPLKLAEFPLLGHSAEVLRIDLGASGGSDQNAIAHSMIPHLLNLLDLQGFGLGQLIFELLKFLINY